MTRFLLPRWLTSSRQKMKYFCSIQEVRDFILNMRTKYNLPYDGVSTVREGRDADGHRYVTLHTPETYFNEFEKVALFTMECIDFTKHFDGFPAPLSYPFVMHVLTGNYVGNARYKVRGAMIISERVCLQISVGEPLDKKDMHKLNTLLVEEQKKNPTPKIANQSKYHVHEGIYRTRELKLKSIRVDVFCQLNNDDRNELNRILVRRISEADFEKKLEPSLDETIEILQKKAKDSKLTFSQIAAEKLATKMGNDSTEDFDRKREAELEDEAGKLRTRASRFLAKQKQFR